MRKNNQVNNKMCQTGNRKYGIDIDQLHYLNAECPFWVLYYISMVLVNMRTMVIDPSVCSLCCCIIFTWSGLYHVWLFCVSDTNLVFYLFEVCLWHFVY